MPASEGVDRFHLCLSFIPLISHLSIFINISHSMALGEQWVFKKKKKSEKKPQATKAFYSLSIHQTLILEERYIFSKL